MNELDEVKKKMFVGIMGQLVLLMAISTLEESQQIIDEIDAWYEGGMNGVEFYKENPEILNQLVEIYCSETDMFELDGDDFVLADVGAFIKRGDNYAKMYELMEEVETSE